MSRSLNFGTEFQNLTTLSESPNQQKLQFLAEKWHKVSESFSREKSDRKEALDEKVRGLEDRTYKDKINDETQFRVSLMPA